MPNGNMYITGRTTQEERGTVSRLRLSWADAGAKGLAMVCGAALAV